MNELNNKLYNIPLPKGKFNKPIIFTIRFKFTKIKSIIKYLKSYIK